MTDSSPRHKRSFRFQGVFVSHSYTKTWRGECRMTAHPQLGTCLVPALIDDPRCGRCIITKSQSPKFTGGLGAAWLGRVN
ncbi:hypothetical protein PoB_001327700 [Plakobranchus ocellatus]|uniref:Uncharacterized protein n=1 Tax=Plakobranchus ocellatus TaxID=259542 RepID=A0AAV3YWP7_9GAST|nr:hypothetical protein PoB_001327700 [Plakobranchus ocellatus]